MIIIIIQITTFTTLGKPVRTLLF